MRYGGDFEPSTGSDLLAGGQGSSEYSYKSMDEARARGEVVEGSFPVYFDARWSEHQAEKFTTYMEDGFFLDRNTKNVKMSLLAFNGDAQQFIFAEVAFEFESAGVISVNSRISLFRRWPYETP